ncbi:MAG: alkaline phosphatase family protein [Actinomycetota bacterium]
MSHSGPWSYLQRVPLVFYGPGFIRARGEVSPDREVTLADLAPTMAELLNTRMPPGIPGRPIEGILKNNEDPPRVIVTIVWDGGGWNVLRAWPDSWPRLAGLIRGGASVEATVGSSPSVTPSIHATIGTGAYPRQTGIIGISFRSNGEIVDSFGQRSPRFLLRPTLADVYDRSTGNAAKIAMLAYKSWHLAMLGHGASIPGGDRDIAALVNLEEELTTNPELYALPSYLQDLPGLQSSIRAIDLDDGSVDSKWMGHDILEDPAARRDTPAWILYQTILLKALMQREGFGQDDVPDLLYTNYKHLDEVGHNWNLISREMRETLHYSDRSLAQLESFLNDTVGRRRWVLVLTADHGQGPDAEASGAWPISQTELVKDTGDHFDVDPDSLITNTSAVGAWVDKEVMASEGITLRQISRFLLDYRLEENVQPGDEPPAQYEPRLREPVFSAAFPYKKMVASQPCAGRG